MMKAEKSSSALLSPDKYVLLFDLGGHVGGHYHEKIPACVVVSKEDAPWDFRGREIIPVVPREVWQRPDGSFEPLPLISMTRRFADSKTSLKRVPQFSDRAMKLYRDLLVDMYRGDILDPAHASNDHVIPRSFGSEGRTRWKNNVTTLKRVNNRKGARTPDESGLSLLLEPWSPTFEDLAMLRLYAETGSMGDYRMTENGPSPQVYEMVTLHRAALRRREDYLKARSAKPHARVGVGVGDVGNQVADERQNRAAR